jgi:hypothetical protein
MWLESPALAACLGGHSFGHPTSPYRTEPTRTDQNPRPTSPGQTLLNRREQKMGSHVLTEVDLSRCQGLVGETPIPGAVAFREVRSGRQS